MLTHKMIKLPVAFLEHIFGKDKEGNSVIMRVNLNLNPGITQEVPDSIIANELDLEHDENARILRFVKNIDGKRSKVGLYDLYKITILPKIEQLLSNNGYEIICPLGKDGGLVITTKGKIQKVYENIGMSFNEKNLRACKMSANKIPNTTIPTYVCKPNKVYPQYVEYFSYKDKEYPFINETSDLIDEYDGHGIMHECMFDELFGAYTDEQGIDYVKVTGYTNLNCRIKGNIRRIPAKYWEDECTMYCSLMDFIDISDFQLIQFVTNSNQLKDALPGRYELSTKYIRIHQTGDIMINDTISDNIQGARVDGQYYYDKMIKNTVKLNTMFQKMFNGDISAKRSVLRHLSRLIESNENSYKDNVSTDSNYKLTIRDMLLACENIPFDLPVISDTLFNVMRSMIRDKVLKDRKYGIQGYLCSCPLLWKKIQTPLGTDYLPCVIAFDHSQGKYFKGIGRLIGYPTLHLYCHRTVYGVDPQYFRERGFNISDFYWGIMAPDLAIMNRDSDGDPILLVPDDYCREKKYVAPRIPIKPLKDKSKIYSPLQEMMIGEYMRKRVGILDAFLSAKMFEHINNPNLNIRQRQKICYDIAIAVQFIIDSAKGIDFDDINKLPNEVKNIIGQEYQVLMHTSGRTYRHNVYETIRRLYKAYFDSRTASKFIDLIVNILKIMGKSKINEYSKKYINENSIDYPNHIQKYVDENPVFCYDNGTAIGWNKPMEISNLFAKAISNNIVNDKLDETINRRAIINAQKQITSYIKILDYDEQNRKFKLKEEFVDNDTIKSTLYRLMLGVAICNILKSRTSVVAFTIIRDTMPTEFKRFLEEYVSIVKLPNNVSMVLPTIPVNSDKIGWMIVGEFNQQTPFWDVNVWLNDKENAMTTV